MTINLVSMNAGDTRAVAEWLVDGARSAAQPQQVIMAQLCDRLRRCGGGRRWQNWPDLRQVRNFPSVKRLTLSD